MKSRLATAAALGLALGSIPLDAAQAQSLTAAQELCRAKALPAGFAPAAATIRAAPEFPEADAAEESEGWVQLGFTIGTEGDTKDIVVLDRVGSQAMARAARLAVARWKYKPATETGLAVEQYGNSAELLFRDKRIGNAAIHDAVVEKFDEGRGLIATGKYSEGIAVLEQTLELGLTLFERARVSFALAFAYEKSNDKARALGHIRHALIENGSFLEKSVLASAQRLRLRLEVANGNFHYAACAPPLPAGDKFDPTGADRAETMRIVDEAMRRVTSVAPLTVDATLTPEAGDDDRGVWEHPMARQKFKFASFAGTLQEFRLSCTRELMNGPVSETAQLNVPRTAGPCMLRVYGSVGARLRLIEEW